MNGLLPEKYYSRGYKYWLLGHILFHWKKLSIVIFLTVAAVGLQTYIPILFGKAIDEAIPSQNHSLLQSLSFSLLFLGLLRGVLNYIASILNEQIAQDVEMGVRVEFFDSLASKSMSFYNHAKVGDLMSQATQDTQNLTFAISPGVRSVVFAVIGLGAAGVVMTTLSPLLSLALFLLLPFYIYSLFKFARTLQPVSFERQRRLAKINSILQENITGIRVVRTFSAEEYESRVFEKEVREYESILVRRGSISGFFVPYLLLGIATGLIFLLGIQIINAGNEGVDLFIFGFSIPVRELSIGDLIAFITLMGLLMWPTQILRFLLDATMLGFAGAERIFSTLKADLGTEQSGGSFPEISGNISFNNISFSYDNKDFLALRNFSLDIKQGEKIAILGPTGSGKSTLARLLLRLYTPQDGVITIDGIDINEIDLGHLRRNVGYIEQDIYLFSTSIKSNIAYGNQDVTDEQIIHAAKIAQAHDFILKLPDGYDTIIGERGVTLSGGQKQRIALARTFITNPSIIILDDSTSAVDAETEQKINMAVDRLLENRTTIIVTNKLSVLRDADKIVFMRLGSVVRMGTHEELLRDFEPYRQIFDSFIELPPVPEVI